MLCAQSSIAWYINVKFHVHLHTQLVIAVESHFDNMLSSCIRHNVYISELESAAPTALGHTSHIDSTV